MCEILTDLIPDNLGVPLTPDIANCLYTGVATDTGCFRFTSTTAKTHLAAARLIEAGAEAGRLNEILFECRSHSRIEAEREALESLEYYFDDRCAMICLTRDQIVQTGVANAELEDLTSLPRSIEGVKVGRRCASSRTAVSRSVCVHPAMLCRCRAIARRLGGGGHNRAAGWRDFGQPWITPSARFCRKCRKSLHAVMRNASRNNAPASRTQATSIVSPSKCIMT